MAMEAESEAESSTDAMWQEVRTTIEECARLGTNACYTGGRTVDMFHIELC